MSLADILKQLHANALRVSNNLVEFSLTQKSFVFDPTILKTRQGLDISLDDIILQDGVWTYQGYHVLLFIPDQGMTFIDVINVNKEGRKFHLTDCVTLQEMKAKGRFQRYRVTNNTEGIFEIHGINKYTGGPETAEAKLNVCKNCLDRLNYQNYQRNKRQVYDNFNLEVFFKTYQTYFTDLPRDIGQSQPGYARDWDSISLNYRSSKKWCCENCGVKLVDHKRLLHTHHIDGVKHHNDYSNLRAVCLECHSKEPNHDHMIVSADDLALLQILRYNYL